MPRCDAVCARFKGSASTRLTYAASDALRTATLRSSLTSYLSNARRYEHRLKLKNPAGANQIPLSRRTTRTRVQRGYARGPVPTKHQAASATHRVRAASCEPGHDRLHRPNAGGGYEVRRSVSSPARSARCKRAPTSAGRRPSIKPAAGANRRLKGPFGLTSQRLSAGARGGGGAGGAPTRVAHLVRCGQVLLSRVARGSSSNHGADSTQGSGASLGKPKCSSIFRATRLSVTSSMGFIRRPQVSQSKTSIEKTRCINSGNRSPRARSCAGM